MRVYTAKASKGVVYMKTKYQRLTKEEKKALVAEYRSISPKNDNFMHTINKMFVLGIIGTVYGIISAITDFIFPFTTVWNFIIDGIVLIFSVFLIVQRNRFKESALNNFLIDKKAAEEMKSAIKPTKKTSKKKETKKDEKKTTKKRK